MITIYTLNGCGKCERLMEKLASKGIKFNTISDRSKLMKLGILEVPVLDVNGERFNFLEANQWVNGQGVK